MRQLFNQLHVLMIIFFVIPLSAYANLGVAPDYDAPAPVVSENNSSVQKDITSVGLASTAPRHQDSMTAVDFASVHNKNLTTKEAVVLAKRNGVQDCKLADGTGIHATGEFDETTVCEQGYVPYEIVSTNTAQTLAGRALQYLGEFTNVATGRDFRGITYQLVCCKAYVGYS